MKRRAVVISVFLVLLVIAYPMYDFYDGWFNGHDISYYLVNDSKDTVLLKDENTSDRMAIDSVIRGQGYKVDTDMYYPLPPKDTLSYGGVSATGTLHFKFLLTYYRFFKPQHKYIYIKYLNHEYTINLGNKKYYTYSSEKDTINFFLHLNSSIFK